MTNWNMRGIDPAHIWLVANQAAPRHDQPGPTLVVRGVQGALVASRLGRRPAPQKSG